MRPQWAKFDGSRLEIDGRQVVIPGYTLIREAGRGANAIVFEAKDQALERHVAVKIWNRRGVSRAQQETAKIASFNHPLVVQTFHFGTVGEHPYAVMELLAGESGKLWMQSRPNIQQRCWCWHLYSRSLKFIHQRNEIHGDPHLGNIIVIDRNDEIADTRRFRSQQNFALKIADAGTSFFWTDHSAIERRESELIRETAGKLFFDQGLDRLIDVPHGIDHRATLKIFDALYDLIHFVTSMHDYDRRSENAGIVSDIVTQVPIFILDGVMEKVRSSGLSESRTARRINQHMLRLNDLFDAEDYISDQTKLAYSKARSNYLSSIL